MVFQKSYLDRDAVLDKFDEMIYRDKITEEQKEILIELGNAIAELPKKTTLERFDMPK